MADAVRQPPLRSLLCMLGLVVSPLPATAEWNTDLYGGGSFTMNHDAMLRRPGGTAIFSGVNSIRPQLEANGWDTGLSDFPDTEWDGHRCVLFSAQCQLPNDSSEQA